MIKKHQGDNFRTSTPKFSTSIQDSKSSDKAGKDKKKKERKDKRDSNNLVTGVNATEVGDKKKKKKKM